MSNGAFSQARSVNHANKTAVTSEKLHTIAEIPPTSAEHPTSTPEPTSMTTEKDKVISTRMVISANLLNAIVT